MSAFLRLTLICLCSGITAALWLPTCQASAPVLNNLTAVRTAYTSVLAASPFDVIYGEQKERAFVAAGQYLFVLDTSSFPPTVLYNITLSTPGYPVNAASGLTLSQGKYILITVDTDRLVVVDAQAAATGRSLAVLGSIVVNPAAGASGIEVVSDGTTAFVTNERGSASTNGQGTVEVFRVIGSKNHTVYGNSTGYITLDKAVVGISFSSNRSRLYVTSQQSTDGTTCEIYGGSTNMTVTPGTISVLDTAKMKKNASAALIAQMKTGYGAVRVIVSPDHKYVWIASRESNHLLAYDAEKLISDPNNALIVSVQVGTSPIDLTFARNSTLILTADSNRYGYVNTTIATAGLSVVDVHTALSNRSQDAVIGSIATGNFPRAFATSPDGNTILVALYGSKSVQAIDVSTLP